jgi:hypothetical protein
MQAGGGAWAPQSSSIDARTTYSLWRADKDTKTWSFLQPPRVHYFTAGRPVLCTLWSVHKTKKSCSCSPLAPHEELRACLHHIRSRDAARAQVATLCAGSLAIAATGERASVWGDGGHHSLAGRRARRSRATLAGGAGTRAAATRKEKPPSTLIRQVDTPDANRSGLQAVQAKHAAVIDRDLEACSRCQASTLPAKRGFPAVVGASHVPLPLPNE